MTCDIVGGMSASHWELLILLLGRRWIGKVRVRELLGERVGLVGKGGLLGVVDYHGSRRPRS